MILCHYKQLHKLSTDQEVISLKPFLFPCASIRRVEMPQTLSQAKIPFEELCVYETISTPSLPPHLHFWRATCGETQCQDKVTIVQCIIIIDHEGVFYNNNLWAQVPVDWICFFSPSGVKAVYDELQKEACISNDGDGDTGSQWQEGSRPHIAAIGPTTAHAIEQVLGVRPHAVAATACPSALLDAIQHYYHHHYQQQLHGHAIATDQNNEKT